MKQKKLTVTVGIPVHNEQANIQGLLSSIVRQYQQSYVLENVFVLCDGTTDETPSLVSKMAKKYRVIHVVNDGKRMGKLKRVEQLYARNRSDIVCVFDGDVMLGKQTVLEDMVKHFADKRVGIVGGNNQPIAATTVIGKLVNTWSHVWYLSRSAYNGGDNIHNIRGCAIALRKAFTKTIRFPTELASESQYLYLLSKRGKTTFVFEKHALVYYRKPLTIADYLSQFKRSSPESDKLKKIFGTNIAGYYPIPKRYTVLALMKSLIENPFLTVAAGVFTFAMSILPAHSSMIGRGVWNPVQSTKKGIPVPF